MKQILQIFMKDTWRFWVEIAISVAILLGFSVLGAKLALRTDLPNAELLSILAALLGMLVPVSWWVLITRVIQAERLVGDTQFWITRPYVRTSLMGAKALFVLAFIYLPFFAAQFVVLAGVGFSPWLYITGLLFNLVLLTGIVFLPLASLATVTSSLVRSVLTILGILVALIAVTSVIAFLFAGGGAGIGSETAGPISFAISIAVCGVAIGMQYTLRRVWLARGVLLVLPLLLVAVTYLGSKYDQARMDKLYPALQGAPPIRIAYAPDPKSTETFTLMRSSRAMIPISLRLDETGVDAGQLLLTEAVRAELTAADGSKWDSEWQGAGGYKFLSGEQAFKLSFYMPIGEYWKYQGKPLAVHLQVALTQAETARTTTVALPKERFNVANFGVCAPSTGWSPEPGKILYFSCVAPLHQPELTYVTTRWSDGPCTGTAGGPQDGPPGTLWVGSLESWPADLNLAPVTNLRMQLSNPAEQQQAGGAPRFRALCPGTPIVFTQFRKTRQLQTSLDVQGFLLPKITEDNGQISVSE